MSLNEDTGETIRNLSPEIRMFLPQLQQWFYKSANQFKDYQRFVSGWIANTESYLLVCEDLELQRYLGEKLSCIYLLSQFEYIWFSLTEGSTEITKLNRTIIDNVLTATLKTSGVEFTKNFNELIFKETENTALQPFDRTELLQFAWYLYVGRDEITQDQLKHLVNAEKNMSDSEKLVVLYMSNNFAMAIRGEYYYRSEKIMSKLKEKNKELEQEYLQMQQTEAKFDKLLKTLKTKLSDFKESLEELDSKAETILIDHILESGKLKKKLTELLVE